VTPEVARFATWVAEAGFTVFVPDLFGVAGRPKTAPYLAGQLARACVSREFALLAADRSSPVTDWLTARLPAASNTMTRSPGISKKVILRKVLTWSTPALVRESDRNTRPSSTWHPTQ